MGLPESREVQDQASETELLRKRLADSEETLRAIREGEVDALVVSGPGGDRVYTLEGADQAYRTIIETMNEGAVTLDEAGHILYSNQPFADLVGAPLEAVIGSSIHDYLLPGDRSTLVRLMGLKPGDAGVRDELELTVRGRKIPVYVSMSRIDMSGVHGLCLVVTDLSEQRRLDRERAEELEWLVAERTRDVKLLSEVVENMPAGVDIWKLEDPDDPRSFRMVSSNRAAEALTGLSRADEAGSLLWEKYPRFYETGVPDRYLEALRTGVPARILEVEYGDERLERRYWSIIAVPLPGDHLATIFEDISPQKETERELRKFKELADSSSEAIAVTDSEMRLIYTNAAYEDLYGYGRGELFGMRVNDLSISELPDMEDLRRAGGQWRGELEVRRKDGATVPVLYSAGLLRDDEGNVIGRVGMLRDISARKRAEERLERANSELKAYAHTVSHDLRSPLTSVVLANEAMRDELTGPEEALRAEVAESTEVISRNVSKVYDLVNDLLTLAESGQAPVKVAEVDVTEVVRRVLDEQAHAIEEKGVEVRMDDDLGRVRANETQVYQVFLNLITNAIRHNDSEAPVVEIRKSAAREGARGFLVRDNSSGIPARIMENLFVPFQKKPGAAGKGIGLAIVKKIIDVYGGEIRAYNENGTNFEFSIPDLEPPAGEH